MHQLEMDFLSSLMNIAGIADNNFPLKRGVLQEDSKLASGSLQASFPTSYKLPFLPAHGCSAILYRVNMGGSFMAAKLRDYQAYGIVCTVSASEKQARLDNMSTFACAAIYEA
jgi:hypothetical protein